MSETSNAPTASSTPTAAGERWFDPVPADWASWVAFRAQASASRTARNSLRNLLVEHLDESTDHEKLGLGWLAAGEPERALGHLSASTGDLPKMLAGAALRQLRRPAEAAEAWKALLGSKAVGAAARVAYVDVLYDLGRDDELEKAAAQMVEPSEKDFAQGLLAERRGDHGGAIEALERAVTADPENAEATFRLARLLDLRGEDDEALELYDRFRTGELPPHANALMNLGILYMDQEDPRYALTCFRLVAAADPTDERVRRYLRDAEASLEQYYDESRERKADKQSALLRTPVTDFELSVRARNCLQRMNIHTLYDLVRRTENELLSFKNFGETSLQEVKDILAMKGLRLGMTTVDEERLQPPPAPVEPETEDADPLDVNISDLDLSVRSRAALATLGITKVRELTQTTETTLLSCKNFGQTSLDEVRAKLRNLGLDLAG